MREKTNASRKLSSAKIPFAEHHYPAKEALNGVEVAKAIGQEGCRVFKTLVTQGRSGTHYVFMIPVAAELDMKKAAAQVGEKSVEMIKAKELLPLTGYVHGGCSPIGMKKIFRTIVHSTAQEYATIIFSGGKIGYQIELALAELAKVVAYELADVVKDV